MVDVATINLLFMTAAGIIFIGVFGEAIFSKTKIPDTLWLVVLGIIVGPVLGLVAAQDMVSVVPFFASLALIVILFEGGLHLNIFSVIRNTPTAIKLALIGMVLSVGIITIIFEAVAFLGFLPEWQLAYSVLVGIILGGTGSVTLVPLMMKAKMGKR